jgi:hypothetical protein
MCARQNGQAKVRLKTNKTFFLPGKSERLTVLPEKSGKLKSGAAWLSDTRDIWFSFFR